MSTLTATKDLRNMDLTSLLSEARQQEKEVAQLHMSILLKKEKDTAKYQKARKQLARIKTIISEKYLEEKRNPPTHDLPS